MPDRNSVEVYGQNRRLLDGTQPEDGRTMKRKRIMVRARWLMGVLAVLLLCAAGPVQAQGGRGGRGGRGAGNQGSPGNFDPAQIQQQVMQQQQMDRIRDQIGAKEDEWAVLKPKIEAVMALQRETRSGGGPGGPGGGPGGPQSQSALQTAASELRQAIDKRDTPADQIQQKVTAYREAKAATRKRLQDAQKALQELVTQAQEAVLVSADILE
ncbi:MAG: hypothetical protein ACHRHE_09030 [Tepidisphaerales bacterium]